MPYVSSHTIEWFAFTQSMMNTQVLTDTNGVARYVVLDGSSGGAHPILGWATCVVTEAATQNPQVGSAQ